MEEIWKDIPDTDGKYQVSNMGRVRSRCKKDEWRLRVFDYNRFGYAAVHIQVGGHDFRKYVHRLVAEAFVPGYKDGLVVNHKNEIKTDNRADNLEWVTHKQNANYGMRNQHASESLRAKKRLYGNVKVEKPSTEQDFLGEDWRDVKGYEGIYVVSNMGRVKSLKRLHINGGIMRQWQTMNGKGLLSVNLCDSNGKHHILGVARLVATAFIEGQSNELRVKHVDGNILNNHADNLRWVSKQEVKGKIVVQTYLDGEFIAEHASARAAAASIGVKNSSYISRCCSGKFKTAYGYIWKYKDEK